MTTSKYQCPMHAREMNVGTACPDCEAIMRGPLPETREARAAEVDQWDGMVLTVHFPMLQQRLEGLVGRPVWTHEIAWPAELAAEIRAGERVANPAAHAIAKLRRHKPGIGIAVVSVDRPDPSGDAEASARRFRVGDGAVRPLPGRCGMGADRGFDHTGGDVSTHNAYPVSPPSPYAELVQIAVASIADGDTLVALDRVGNLWERSCTADGWTDWNLLDLPPATRSPHMPPTREGT